MTIIFSASEMVPFCKTGGLADVVGALPPVLAEKGHDVRVMIPGYTTIDKKPYGFRPLFTDMTISVGTENAPLTVSTATWNGVTICLLENEMYFCRAGLYGDKDGDYRDNAERFVFYARSVMETMRRMGLSPDIVHCHDWQAGLVPAYLATVYADEPLFYHTATLFTVHNLGYQGLFPMAAFDLTGLPVSALDWRRMEYWGKVSFLKAGFVYAGAISTVSESYADEITREPLGFGMHGVFAERRDSLHGIVNGIDQDEWNPATDTVIPASYGPGRMQGKAACRASLLARCGFKGGNSDPVIGMVTRLDDQKGLDILEEAVGKIAALNIRLAILGTGTQKHHDTMTALSKRYSDRISVFLRFDNDMARLIYAGSDAFLMPSRYEPCGLGQLIAMRYGTLPIVHATGGLRDTVQDLDDHPDDGDGFVFGEYSADALAGAVTRAVKAFREKGKRRWNAAVLRVMKRDFSWGASADRYVALYESLGNHPGGRASK